MGDYSSILANYRPLQLRNEDSGARIARVRACLASVGALRDPGLSVFVAGSLGRGEAGGRSDLDLFVVATKAFTEDEQYNILGQARSAAEELGYGAPTERFFKVYGLGDLLRKTGSPEDDTHNSFTARMLLLLESKPAINDGTYLAVRNEVLRQYFRDERGRAEFRPLFLLNDILRYWRTLCLNYEDLRHDQARPWWKKNANLKFSRMLTVYATVATLTVEDINHLDDFQPICELSPLQRLARALDALDDNSLLEPFVAMLDSYEAFLRWKEALVDEQEARKGYDGLRSRAEAFSNFLYELLNHANIPTRRRKFLVI